MPDVKRFLVAGQWRQGSGIFEVVSPYAGATVATAATPGDADVAQATTAIAAAFSECRKLP
ncbi:MAG: aldehyde dehydrogenase family protein, partial [Actinomycetota bacterium]